MAACKRTAHGAHNTQVMHIIHTSTAEAHPRPSYPPPTPPCPSVAKQYNTRAREEQHRGRRPTTPARRCSLHEYTTPIPAIQPTRQRQHPFLPHLALLTAPSPSSLPLFFAVIWPTRLGFPLSQSPAKHTPPFPSAPSLCPNSGLPGHRRPPSHPILAHRVPEPAHASSFPRVGTSASRVIHRRCLAAWQPHGIM
jgi:hypothetical protein